jgi:hypothetical protein
MKIWTSLTERFALRRFLLIGGALASVAALGALPAGATTPATFTLTAGGLSITAPTASVDFGSQQSSTSASTISSALGNVTVTDDRAGTLPWTASVIATAFTPGAGPAVPASNFSYAAGPITTSATITATAVPAVGLAGVTTVVTGAKTGIGTATWNPTLTVDVTGFAPGIYTATITHSVA